MAEFLVIPSAREVLGEVDAPPPSKSATNRALVLAALSADPIEIVRPLESDDTIALVRCLTAMGARIEKSIEGLVVRGPLGAPAGRETLLDVGESGTAARFLTAFATAIPGRFLVTGAARLRERPMAELADALASLGAAIEFRDRKGFLPIAVEGRPLAGGRVVVDASRSSQFLSALLLLGAATREGIEVEAAGPLVSAPYVAMTVETLLAFGHSAEVGRRFRVSAGTRAPARYLVPGDYSSALPLLASVGAVGGKVLVRRLAWPSHDADAQALPVLEAMGITIDAQPATISAARLGDLRPTRARAADFPDAVPALAAIAALAPGESRFEGIGHLRLKESDRIDSLVRLVTSAGGRAEADGSALVVRGPIAEGHGPARKLPTANDHRIAMAGALLCLRTPGLLLQNPGCVAKSYPGFFRDLEKLVRR